MRESRTYGSVRAKAKWLSYSTIIFRRRSWMFPSGRLTHASGLALELPQGVEERGPDRISPGTPLGLD